MSSILYNAYIYFAKLKFKTIANEVKPENLNIIGIFDEELNIWYNGWSIYDPDHYEKYKLSKELLIYGLNIERDMGRSDIEKAIIKSILVNSKFYIAEKQIQLNVILSLITYFIKPKNYSYIKTGSLLIYVVELNDNKYLMNK